MSEEIKFYNAGHEYGEFSNFSKHSIAMDGKEWKTVEHYFQAMKFNDIDYQEEIRLTSSPAQVKKLGNSRLYTIKDDWEDIKDDIMYEAVLAKFTQHDDLRILLINTGDSEIVEHTDRDSYWGDGGDGSGSNMLGQIFMAIRDELRREI